MPNLVEIGPVVLEKKILKNFVNVFSIFCNYLIFEKGWDLQWFWRRRWKCEKFTTTTTTTTTDNRQILIRKAHLSLGLRWAKNILLPILNLKHRKTSYKSVTVLVFFNYIPVNIFTNFANIIWCKDVWFTICLVEYWYFFGKNFLVSVVYLKW